MSDVVKRYFAAWTNRDAAALREVLADQVTLDMGGELMFISADEFVGTTIEGPQWKDAKLLQSITEADDKAALLYEAVNSVTNDRVRVGEFLSLKDGKITASVLVTILRKP